MTTDAASRFVQQCHRTAVARDGADQTDGQLLGSYVERRDEAAFEALVRRHGPMVLGVCRRLLRDHHDAEEAFQATFLVLVRKAAAVRPRDKVADWLYGVARQTAVRLRAATARRRGREGPGTAPEPAAPPEAGGDDLRPVLDQELGRLPYKYRAPVVLCDLEGRTYKHAAGQLGWPEGTVASRLVRARAMLAGRLTRRGVVLPAGAVSLVLAREAAGGVPAPLVASAVDAAGPASQAPPGVTELSERVVAAMFWGKIRAAAVLVAGVTACGALLAYHSPGAAPVGDPPPAPKAGAGGGPARKERSDRDKLQGAWDTAATVRDGRPAPDAPVELRPRVVIAGDKYAIDTSVGFGRVPTGEMSFKLNPARNPKEMDLVPAAGPYKGKTIPAIYALDGNELKICFGTPGGDRPAAFVSRADSGTILVTLERVEP